MAATEWKPIETAPDGIEVLTKIHDADGCRNVQTLKRNGRLWFVPDGSMYVYYVPTHWMPMSGGGACSHERLNEEGACRACGADCRGIG